MKIKHILTLSLIMLAMTSWGQTWNQQFLYRNIKFGNTVDGVLQFNGLATFVNGINVPLRSLSDSTDNAASTKFVKQLVQGLGSPLTFGNGLTKTSNSVGLGGDANWIIPSYLSITAGDISDANSSAVFSDNRIDLRNSTPFANLNNIILADYQGVTLEARDSNLGYGSSLRLNNLKNIIDDGVRKKGLYLNEEYSKNWTSEDSTALTTKAYVDRSISSAVSGNYIATNNGTGNNTALNTPSITNGSANNMTVGLTSPTAGRFTALTATTTATVPTVATSDNSTNAASTAYVKANLANYAKLNGGNNFRDPQFIVGDTALIALRNNSNTSGSTLAYNYLSLRNSVGNGQLTWGNLTNTGLTWQPPNASGTLARVEDFATGQTIGANTTGNSATSTAPQNASTFKTALATSLQDVTSVGNTTTTGANFGGSIGIGNSSPMAKLDVSGGNLIVSNENTYATKFTGGTTKGLVAGYSESLNAGIIGSINPNVAWTNTLINPNDGSVGIGLGLSTPLEKLDVNGNIFARGSFKSNNLTGNGSAPIVADANGVLSRGVDNTVSVSSVSGTSQSMSANRVYIPHSTSLTTFTLPTTATEGQLFQIVGEGSGGWRVSQNASQQIVGVNVATTSGTTGYVQSTNANCTITIRCTVANSKFTITSSQGTLTIN